MIKKILLAALIFSLPLLLFSETILLYTISETDVVDENQFSDLIESAVMNEFFDAGHIMFNAFVSGEVPEHGLEHYKEPASMQLAKAGGAAFLLEVSLAYSNFEGRSLPGFAGFRLIDVFSGDVIKNGSVNIDSKWIDKGDFENGLTNMGESVASYALNFL
jgi:hypothetical protein